ncbi:Homocysteine S-methyltransferase [Apodospora peruviana]|uniref:Homocysteine S-methyltransferase n=1 Tax=Apodospora peruviana TaxID=516989 RepID=A0AAE0IRP3_9PEZI|nr:Homocysteine S-methyltransferase [Apodospora peruviana]
MPDATPIKILDGGLGTSLEDKYNVDFSTKTPLWSSQCLLSDQDTLLKCQTDFGNAGADIISTATYQTSINGFEASGVSVDDIPKFLADAVSIAKKASSARDGNDGEVALSLGPYGATMIPSAEYSGKYDAEHGNHDALAEWHNQRLELFTKMDDSLLNEIKYLAFETIPRIDEIIAIRTMMKDMSASKSKLAQIPMWISCLFPGDDETLPGGWFSAQDVVDVMMTKGIFDTVPWGIGINCTKVSKLPSLVKRFEAIIRDMIEDARLEEWPSLVLYPDGTNGEVYNTATKKWEVPDGVEVSETPWETQLADVVKATKQSGQWRSILVGGCCKTTHKDIARLREALLGVN